MGNTVGSQSSLLNDPEHSYVLGLWGADKYVRSSSVGLSNTNLEMLHKFTDFLLARLPQDRLRVRIYGDAGHNFEGFTRVRCKGSRNRTTAYHVYVNSRSLVREFYQALGNRHLLSGESLCAYFAGRFDGDGSMSQTGSAFCRIAYSSLEDARLDKNLLPLIQTSIYNYTRAGTYCLYFSEKTLGIFLQEINPYSVKLLRPRID